MHKLDIIGADLVDLYPERFAAAARMEVGRVMPVCPLCGTGNCTSHPPTEEPMSLKDQQTEDKAIKPTKATKDARPDAEARTVPDLFEGTYEELEGGRIRFTKEVILQVPTAGGSHSHVLVAPVGMVVAPKWLDDKRALYGFPQG